MTELRKVITQGEYFVSDDENVQISILLGSCVACCLWDPLLKIGGANHMLIAHQQDSYAVTNEIGVNAMELLINDILKMGGAKNRLVAKVFGGACMVDGLSQIGAENCAFTLDFLAEEGIECVSESLGGSHARHLLFWPVTGIARQKFVTERKVLDRRKPCHLPSRNGLELF